MPRVTFIRAADGTALTKHITANPNGTLPYTVSPYPFVKNLNSHEYEWDDITELYDLIEDHAEDGWAMMTGRFHRDLSNESRSGLCDKDTLRELLILDFDGIEGVTVEDILRDLDFDDVDHVIQYSARHALPGHEDKLRCHVFARLSFPVDTQSLKRWMMQANFNTPVLRRNIRLTDSKRALHYPLDIVLAEPSRIVYIAPPIFHNIEDPLGEKRIQCVEGISKTATLDFGLVSPMAQLDEMRDQRILTLQREAGVPITDKTTRKIKGYDGEQYRMLSEPGYIDVEFVEEARGFCYLNLAGGDSRAYFHPATNPKYLFNFKGEPVLPIEKINPKYYEQARARAKVAKLEEKRKLQQAEREIHMEIAKDMFDPLTDEALNKQQDPVNFYFTDDATSQYRVATYYPDERRVHLRPARSKPNLTEFAMQFGLPEPNVVPRCKVEFNPTTTTVFTPETPRNVMVINTYRPSLYKLAAKPGTGLPPETIHNLVTHVLAHCEQAVDRFYNWLAYIFQTGQKAGTAWLLHGRTGTGKDSLFAHVLTPLISEDHAILKRLDQLEDMFEGEFNQALIMMINEANVGNMSNSRAEEKVFNKLNDMITGLKLGIRQLYTEHQTLPSYINILASSNAFSSLRMETNDRRWNVPPRQEIKLEQNFKVSDAFFVRLHAELQDFANFLTTYQVREQEVKTPMVSDAKLLIQETTLSAARLVTQAILNGDFQYLVESLPESDPKTKELFWQDKESKLYGYLIVLDRINQAFMDAPEATETYVNLSRDDFGSIYTHLVQWQYEGAKLNSALRNNGLPLTSKSKIHRNNQTIVGLRLKFHATPTLLEYYRKYYSMNTGPMTKLKILPGGLQAAESGK